MVAVPVASTEDIALPSMVDVALPPMVDVHLISGGVWLLGGLAICYLGYLIAVRGRIDLHSHYDDAIDPTFAAKGAGGTAIVMGLLVVGYGVREILFGFSLAAFWTLMVALLVLIVLSKLFANGFRGRVAVRDVEE